MSAKLCAVALVVALPAMAIREAAAPHGPLPTLSVLFMLMGFMALPLWVPITGFLVKVYMEAVPMVVAPIWLAYGVYRAWPNPWFLWSTSLLLTAGVFLVVETTGMQGLRRQLVNFFIATYALCIGQYLRIPHLALPLAEAMSVALAAGALLGLLVFSAVLPEFSCDAVWESHHEGLEHLLHMAHHSAQSKPPPYLRRADKSIAQRIGSNPVGRQALVTANQGRSSGGAGGGDSRVDGFGSRVAGSSGGGGGGGNNDGGGVDDSSDSEVREAGVAACHHPRLPPLSPWQKADRSFQRMRSALLTGAFVTPSVHAELCLGFCGTWRPIIPWHAWLPGKRLRPDYSLLGPVRMDATDVGLALHRLHAALQLLDAVTRPVLSSVRGVTGASWPTLRAHLLGALDELVGVFPQDYYPPPRPLDGSHVEEFQAGVAELRDAWRELAGGDSAQAAPAAQLYAALILVQLQDLGDSLARLHASCATAMASLEGSLYGFLGLRCCTPSC